jgi:hypothetical protein
MKQLIKEWQIGLAIILFAIGLLIAGAIAQ